MEFSTRLAALSSKVRSQRDVIETEEATKTAFILPFISTILGYDVFNPHEVVPEFTADIGIKKGEKIDYAIVHDGQVQMLIECKRTSGQLKFEHASQLYRYFSATKARIGILTNGEVYQFYTDLDAPNRMDEKPFLILDLTDIDESLVPEIQKMSKDIFDLDSIISAAGELKYIGAIKRLIAQQFKHPDADWVKFFASRTYDGPLTQRVRDQFTALVAKASTQFLTERVNDRLKTALGTGADDVMGSTEVAAAMASQPEVEKDLLDDGIETTLEELEGFHVVRAIVCGDLEVSRIAHRDAKSYFAILADDNNRKPIARLHFNRSQRYIGLFDEERQETRHPIAGVSEIYEHVDALRSTARRYVDAG